MNQRFSFNFFLPNFCTKFAGTYVRMAFSRKMSLSHKARNTLRRGVIKEKFEALQRTQPGQITCSQILPLFFSTVATIIR